VVRAPATIASTSTLTEVTGILPARTTKDAAVLALDAYVDRHPDERDELMIVPEHELAA